MNELDYYPLTHPQKSIWYTEMMYPNTSISNVAGTARIKGLVDFDLLEKAINLLIEKNEGFRIRITCKNGEPMQYVNPFQYKKIDFIDFSKYDSPEAHMYNWDEEQTLLPFELYDSDLFYIAIVKINEHEFGFYAKTHHIVSDAWTMSLLVNEILTFYSFLKKEEDIPCENNPSYIDYIHAEAEYKKSNRFINDQQYWLDKFDPLPEITALKTKATNEKSSKSKRKTVLPPVKFVKKLREYCKENNTTPYPLFLAALSMYINRVTSKSDIVIGTPVLNRSNRKEKNTTGMFINTLPVRIIIDPDINFETFSKNVSIECMSLFRHQKYPYDILLKNIREKYNNSVILYDIVLSYQNSKMEKQVTDDQYMTRWHFNHHQVNSLTIHINDRDDEGRLIIDYDFHEDIYSVKEIEFLHTHMLSLLWHALDNPLRNIKKVEMLPESEKKKVLYEFNNTKADYPKDKTIQQLFEEQVGKTPDSIALVFEDKTMSYAELNRKANQVAYLLREKGVKPDDIVALMMERSFDVVVGMVGILKAGGAFLPIDPDYPDERIKLMLDDSNARILLTQSLLNGRIHTPIEIFEIDTIKCTEYTQNLKHISKSSDLAYIIYTSGSTGKPKGAMIEHRNLVNFIYGVSAIMDFSAGTSVLSMTTISFDIFIFETIPSLVNGLKIILANREQQITPRLLHALILKYNIEKVLGTPSRIQALIEDSMCKNSFKKINEIMVGGDVFKPKLLEKLKKITTAKIFNGYGPTETSIGVTFKDLSESNKINIGKPINNIYLYILDKHMNLVPIGIPGDFYIGGDGVGRGYINRSHETNLKYVTNPFIPGERIYNSGDIARWYPKGEIEFLGRIDHQVKINGLRIELTEIENQFLKVDGVLQAVAVIRKNKANRKLIFAYYTSEREIPSSEIYTQLSKYLPNYMIPAAYVRVEHIPFTHNGKVDINSLPQIDFDEAAVKKYVAPRNDIEKKIASAWKDVLNLEHAGIDNSFFELGGDSLAAIRLQVKLLEYNLRFKVQDLYKYTTIRTLSERLMHTSNCSFSQTEKIHEPSESKICKTCLSEIQIEKTQYNNILLFGATGFLGIHILDYILSNTDGTVYCILRGNSLTCPKNRLEKSLSNYFSDKYLNAIDKRIFILNGDITKKRFGLANNEYELIGKTVDSVIHTAALVKYYGDYSEFEEVNVLGTLNIAEFSLTNNLPLFYVSTMGLAGLSFTVRDIQNKGFSENDLHTEQSYEHNVYLKSKFEAEKLIRRYIDHGLQATIFRVGNLSGRYSDGHFQANIGENYFYSVLKSILSIGAVSDNILNTEFDLTPVDMCSKAVMEIAFTKNCLGKVFHIFNYNMMSVNKLIELLGLIGTRITTLNNEDFYKLIKDLSCNNNVILSGIVNNLNNDYQLDFGYNVKISTDFSADYLKNINFYWPVIDSEYIKKLICYMGNIGFIGAIV